MKQYPEATEVDGMLLLRIDAALYFANVNPVRPRFRFPGRF